MQKTHFVRLGTTLGSSALLLILISLTLGTIAGPTVSYASEQSSRAPLSWPQSAPYLASVTGPETALTAALTLSPTALLTPTNGAALTTTNSPRFQWQPPSGEVVSYTLLITGLSQSYPFTSTTTSYTPTIALASGLYTWTVQAHNAAGEASGFAWPYTFTIDAVPGFGPSPLLAPANGITLADPQATFRWVAANGPVVSYTLYITGPTTALAYTTAATNYTTALSANGSYTWTVQAHNAAGETSGPVSPPNRFTLDATWAVYLPIVIKGPSCPAISTANFDRIPIEGDAADRPGPEHADLNLALRGYEETNEARVLVSYDGGTDPNAPQLDGLFMPDSYPGISSVHQVYDWVWQPYPQPGFRGRLIDDDMAGGWAVTMLGLRATRGEPITIPRRDAEIYGGGYNAMVLYAEERRITLVYTRRDTAAVGYAVHIENVCVDPNLLALYQAQTDAAGWHVTGHLPALRNDQPLGTAFDDELFVVIRDTGQFMDPRSQKDWWKGYPAGLEIQKIHDTLSSKLKVPQDLK